MRSLTNPETTAPEARARVRAGWTSGLVVSVVVGSVLALCALGGLAGGGLLAVGGVDLDLGAHGRYHTPGYALVSDSTNWRTQLFGAVDSVRFRATADGAKPIFVGAARTTPVRRYLHGVRYTTVHEDGNVVQHDGTAPTTAPGAAVDWTTAQSTGTGAQTLRWNRDHGEQVLVAMNTDGTPSVSARVVSSTVTLRAMPTLAAGLLAGGAVLLAISVAFIAISVRRAHATRAEEATHHNDSDPNRR
jgi:hypothetical protein